MDDQINHTSTKQPIIPNSEPLDASPNNPPNADGTTDQEGGASTCSPEADIGLELTPDALVVSTCKGSYNIPRNGKKISKLPEQIWTNADVVVLLCLTKVYGTLKFHEAEQIQIMNVIREDLQLSGTITPQDKLRFRMSFDAYEKLKCRMAEDESQTANGTATNTPDIDGSAKGEFEFEAAHQTGESETNHYDSRGGGLEIPVQHTREGQVRIDSLGIQVPPYDDKELLYCENFCAQAERAVHYVIGDLLLLQPKRYGETYGEAEQIFGKSAKTLMEIKRVCARVEKSGRPDYLRFSHVAAVVLRSGYPVETDSPEGRAELEAWNRTTQELFQRVCVEKLTVKQIKRLLKSPAAPNFKTPWQILADAVDLLKKLTPDDIAQLRLGAGEARIYWSEIAPLFELLTEAVSFGQETAEEPQ